MQTLDYQTSLTQSPDQAAKSEKPLRLLPTRERRSWLGHLLAIVIACAYFWYLFQYWAPAHPGVDQNGYLAGGKYFANTFSTGFIPKDATGFVSTMWVRVPETGMNYPKYPLGLPVLYAIFIWVFGESGYQWAYLVSPIGTALGVLGIYFLSRRFTGVFASICAMLLLAFSQLTLSLANNPNSHGACLACVIWGGYFLIRFWQAPSKWTGLLGGFLLGYAATIRYSEGLLGVLIAVTMLTMIRWTNWRTYLKSAWPLVGWLIPVGLLVIFNLAAMGSPTGYDSTNESKPGSAFTMEHVADNWEKLIRQVHDTGMFFVAPLGIFGLMFAFRRSARLGTFLFLWFFPGLLLYMSYYWAPDRGVSYLRFFLTLLPPALVGVAILLDEVLRRNRTRWSIAAPIACAAVVALSCSLGLYRAILGLEDGQESQLGLETQQRINSNLATTGAIVKSIAPKGAVIFGNQSELNHLQFVGDYELFSRDYYTSNFITRLRRTEETTDPEDPITTQGERRRWLLDRLENKTDKQLVDMQIDIINRSLKSGRRVFVVMNKASVENFNRQVVRSHANLELKVRTTFSDRPAVVTYVESSESKPRPRQGNAFTNALRRGASQARDVQQTWQVAEIIKAPPRPASRPATRSTRP